MNVEGQLISGEFDSSRQEFLIKEIKNLTTESTVNENELGLIHDYLLAHQDEDGGQILSLNDQLLVQLNQSEVQQILQDLEDIRKLF
ncbi:hypothetical protein E3U55_08480 [Filobacillus milosensis]|uniref:Uncharacterized protein n=1 Tax=Filobacillus milosensis TaxID=94137 RepID=A0A4Y8IK17_9BACI|nr:hypothetical protein [Filobacillus milosensis]TFB21342.1 hypothetical protein E3U55_08480 [Filobacillus milosensis]